MPMIVNSFNQHSIVVNARFLTQELTGVQRFGIELSRQLKALDSSIIFVSPQNILNTKLAEELGVIVIGRNTGHLWENLDLPMFLSRANNPLLINLANTAPLFYKNKIIVLHDVAFIRFPKSFSLKFRVLYRLLTPMHLKSSRHIVTVSHFSKSEIAGFYGIDGNKFSVVYNSADRVFSKREKRYSDRYILAVSSLSEQKNFKCLVNAFEKIDDKDVQLYVVGSMNKSFVEQDFLKEIVVNERIKFLGRVDDTELAQLYSDALLFVHPSFYEGFGLPPLEAQTCGCPILISNASCLPEIFAESALYFDPYTTSDLIVKINYLLSSTVARHAFVKKGYANVARYSWRVSAANLYQSIKAVVNND